MNKEKEESKKRSASEAGGAAKRQRGAASAATVDDFIGLVDATSVAIIVPFRDIHAAQKRAMHLKQFIPHMIKFLTKLQTDGLVSDFHIYIMEQSEDGRKFNRGKLLNIGFDMAKKSKRGHDVFIFHDVDLLPDNDLGPWYVSNIAGVECLISTLSILNLTIGFERYAKFPKTPIHIARVWDRYSGNKKYFGGVVSFSSSDYKRINGFP